ncbi:MAG: hypothetical protein ACE5HP_10620, partial [Gemmatimonadota bacterium]
MKSRIRRRMLEAAKSTGLYPPARWAVYEAKRVLCPLTRRGNVVMYHFGRCGSTVISDLLGQHDRVHWDGEVYDRVRQNLAMRAKTGLTAMSELRMTADPVKLLRIRMHWFRCRYYGFEIKPSPHMHLRPGLLAVSVPELVRLLTDRLGFNYAIVLKRKNYLRQTVSRLVGRQRRRWFREGRSGSGLTRV